MNIEATIKLMLAILVANDTMELHEAIHMHMRLNDEFSGIPIDDLSIMYMASLLKK